MASTKIINVLKDDTFREILELCKATPAEEVILIIPRKSKFLSKEDHFAALSAESRSQNKRVSIMTASAEVAYTAHRYGFGVLAERSRKTAKPAAVAQLAVAHDDDGEEEIHEDDIDAYERDVIVPSDEQIGMDHGEEEDEVDGVHVEDADGNIVEDETDEDLEDDLEDASEDKDFDEEDEIDGKRDDLDEEFSVGKSDFDAESASFKMGSQRYHIGTAAARMDGIVSPARRPEKIRVKGPSEKPVKLGFNRNPSRAAPQQIEPAFGLEQRNMEEVDFPVLTPEPLPEAPVPQPEKKLAEIEQVWQHDAVASEANPWPHDEHEKKSFWSNFPTKGAASKPTSKIPSGDGKRKSSPKLIIGFTVLMLAVASGVFYVATSSAKVTIRPIQQSLDVKLKVSLSDSFSSVDTTLNKIPGQLFTIEKSVSQDFQATGEKETVQKARGKLTIYNEFSSAPQTLIATTRFEANNKVFRTIRTVTVPAMNGSGAGTVEVEVVADKPGADYNIPASTFVLPAFREKGDTARYEKFYGKSTDAMRGGVNGLAKIVTEADFNQGKAAVSDKLKTEIQTALESQAAGLTLVDPGIPANTAQVTSNSAIDQAGDTFTMTAAGNIKMMGFKEEDLLKLAQQYIDEKYHLEVFPEKITISHEKAAFDEAKGILDLNVSIIGIGYAKVDKEKILSDIAGKSEQQIRDYFAAAEGIGKTTALLPRLRNMPKDTGKIKFEVIYE